MRPSTSLAHFPQFDSPGFDPDGMDFEAREITEIEEILPCELEVTEPIERDTGVDCESPDQNGTSWLSSLFRSQAAKKQ